MNVEKKQLCYLALTMIVVALAGISIAIYFSHQAAFEEKQADLINLAKGRARVIEAVARFDLEQSADFPEGHIEATLSQFRDAHEKFEGFGESGEFTLAKLEDDQIVFLLQHRHSHSPIHTQPPTSLNSTFEEPMRKALKGESGVIVGLDDRGEKFLAAYEPVAVLNLGLVVKVDLAEIRKPFIKAGILAGIGGFITILLGLIVFFRLSKSLVRSIKDLQGRYERAIKGSKDGLWDWPDINKDEQWWSDDWYGLLGLKNDEIKAGYSNFKSLLHPDDLPRMEEALKQHFYGQDIYDVEYRLKHKSGEYLWFRGRGAVERDAKGKGVRMSGSISDIHQSKQDREAIDRLSQVAQQIPISVLITDHEGNIEFVNEALTRLSGYSTEELLGKNPRIFKSGESPDTYYRVLWETISQGKEWRGVFHNKKKNGELYWESVLIFSLKDINGKVSSFIGLKEDITEKKQLESTLIDHERLIRSVVNNLKDGLIISNTDGNIQLFNKGAEQIFGYRAEEVMDRPVAVLMDESYKEKHDIGFARFNKTKKISPDKALMEVVAQKKDGTHVPIELTLTQMEQRGELLVIGLVRDITKRKEAETRVISVQKQLIAAQKLAGVGQLAAGVSHEVLNPVNIISVHTQMLQRKTKDDANIQNFCDKIKHEIERIQKIMSSLLAFSRKGEVEIKKGNLRDHIESVLGLVEEDYKLDNIKIERDWCDSSVEISFDSDKLRQVYLNLIHNAKHAMPDGGTITVGCREGKDVGKDSHEFTLSDTGTGMSDEVRLKIFEPFFTTKPEGEGTGMGLAVIHGIIEEHGGKIRVESEEGKGTTFIITLPIAI
jgi:nitrogen fixation negative regulator NifL